MRNFKLGVKLVGGFVLTSAIVLGVGLLSIVQQNRLQHEMELINTDNMPAIQNILTLKSELGAGAALMRTLINPSSPPELREFSHQHLLEIRQAIKAARDTFKALPLAQKVEREWQEFGANIAKWSEVNNQTVELSKELIAMDMTNPGKVRKHLADMESGHNALLAKVGKLVYFNTPFEGGADDTACALGKWLQHLESTNSRVKALADEIRPIHSRLHQHVAQAKAGGGEARELLEKKIYPESEQVLGLIRKIAEIADIAEAKFEKMEDLQLKGADAHQAATLAAIDKIVQRVEADATEMAKEAEALARRGILITVVCLVAGVGLAVGLGLVLTRLITRPLFKGVELAKAMAGGDLTRTMDVDQEDEIGVLAKALNEMVANLRQMFGDISQGVIRVDESSVQLAAISNQMASGAGSTAARSGQVAAAAEQMSANQSSIAAAMEEASVNVNMVAAAAEEMSATINEIARNSANAQAITGEAVSHSQKASARVDELGRAADEINKVTETITEISEQTNLLALNATIEAARAGEAGKGFAVVANEIKDLAKQTAEATLDIKTKIQGIQEATGVTVGEISEISTIIADIDKIVTTIAAAVEEQTATTREISQNVQQASQGIGEVNENVAQSSTVSAEIAADIAQVNDSATEMSGAGNQVKDSAEALSGIAEQLKEMVARFRI